MRCKNDGNSENRQRAEANKNVYKDTTWLQPFTGSQVHYSDFRWLVYFTLSHESRIGNDLCCHLMSNLEAKSS